MLSNRTARPSAPHRTIMTDLSRSAVSPVCPLSILTRVNGTLVAEDATRPPFEGSEVVSTIYPGISLYDCFLANDPRASKVDEFAENDILPYAHNVWIAANVLSDESARTVARCMMKYPTSHLYLNLPGYLQPTADELEDKIVSIFTKDLPPDVQAYLQNAKKGIVAF